MAETTGATARRGRVGGLVALAAALAVTCFLSITLGTRGVTLETVWHAFTAYDPGSAAHTVIRDMRLPRTLIGLSAGAALGVSGALLQGVARNPLADPGIMGINAGAAVAIVGAVVLLGTAQLTTYIWFGFAGAAVATFVVYAVASLGREGATPVKLALAGVAVTALFGSVTSALVLSHTEALNELRFWQVGALAGRYAPIFLQTVPFIAVGLLVGLGSARALNGLALGDDLARGQGQRVALTRFVLFVTVAVLCGAATAACGPITFLGLVIPHLARMVVGPDYRWVLAYSLLLGPLVLLVADVIGRLVIAPDELQVGVVLGVLGAPAFVALVRYRRTVQL